MAIGCQNRPEYLLAMFAAQKLHATPINVNYRYRLQELEYLLNDCEAKALVHDELLAPLVAQLEGRVKTLETGVAIGSEAVSLAPHSTPIAEAWLADPHPRTEHHGDHTWLIYTGGTTGQPKLVAFTEASVLERMGGLVFRSLGVPVPASADELWARLFERRGDHLVVLPASPLMHGAGIYGSINALLSAGTVVLLAGQRFDPRELAETISQHRVTDLHIVGDVFGLPLAQTLAAARADGSPYDLSSLRRIQSVGTAWSPEVKAELLAEADVALVDMIAATEGGPFALALATRATETSRLSEFRLAPGARLIDSDDRDVVPGSDTVGVLASPAQEGARYIGDPEASSGVFRLVDDACYSAPGDMAQMRLDGTLRFLGRGSSVINTGGEKVYTAEVEDALRSHPDVSDAVVAATPDARFGSLVGALVEPRPGCDPEPDALAGHVAATLADYKRPRRIVVVPELRRTEVGKPDLAWARERLSTAPNVGIT